MGGSGDSGAIEHIGYFSEANIMRNEQNIPDASEAHAWAHEVDIEPELSSDSKQFIEDNAYQVLDTLEDWWNNEGGQGVLMIDTTTGNYTCNNGVNHMNTEYYSHSGKFTS